MCASSHNPRTALSLFFEMSSHARISILSFLSLSLFLFPLFSFVYLTLGNNFLLGERRDYREYNRQERIPIASTIGDTWDYENNLRVIIPGVPVDVSV